MVTPGRVPASRSAWRTHRRKASAVQPSLPAIDRIAAHCDVCVSVCSNTIRTARSRNSGAYRVPGDIGSILSRKEPSDKPGAIQWRELPLKYPRHQTCHRRFQLWRRTGVLHDVLERLADDLRDPGRLRLWPVRDGTRIRLVRHDP